MSLEALEELCLNFLKESENPLVPLSYLYAHCVEHASDNHALSPEYLLDFLKNHNELLVLESDDKSLLIDEDQFFDAGIVMGTRVILKRRLPDRNALKVLFKLQVLELVKQLNEMLLQAEKNKKPQEAEGLKKKLAQAQSILERFEALESGSSPDNSL
jgi:hypothetical protein